MTAPDVHGETVKALLAASRAAHRCQYVIGTPEYPSAWDEWHGQIDELLDDLIGR